MTSNRNVVVEDLFSASINGSVMESIQQNFIIVITVVFVLPGGFF
jgi:hypothetical protein